MAENHRLLMADFAPGDGLESLAQLSQVHGNDVAVVGSDGPAHDVHGHLHAVGDGLVTTQPGVSLMVRAADCVPVLFADESGGVIGAAHCGRPGLVAGIVPATVAAMRDLGAGRSPPGSGPHVCGRCYEVPQQMQDDVAAVEPASRATTSWGTPSARRRCRRAGPARARRRRRWSTCRRCTRESPDLFSYRRDGRGRDARRASSGSRMSAAGRRDRGRPRRRTPPHRRRRDGGRSRPRRGDAGRRHQVLPGERRADPGRPRRHRRRREPPPRGRRQASRSAATSRLRWHFIGGLQSNKAAAVGSYADVVESVDRAKLVAALEPRSPRAQPRGRRAAPGEPRPAGSRRARGSRPGRPGVALAEPSRPPACSGCAA